MKYLGLTIDSGLTWGSHIDTLCSRLSSACFALSRLRPSLNTDNVKKAYYGYFHSGGLRPVGFDRDVRNLFQEYKILALPSLYILEIAKYVRTHLDQFSTYGDAHNRNIAEAET